MITPSSVREFRRPSEIDFMTDWDGTSSLTLTPVSGPALTMSSAGVAVNTEREIKLQVHADNPLIIGRQEGGENEYLDPRHRPTRIMPNSGRPVVASSSRGIDVSVSRGHFMIRSSPFGIILVNGVPRRGGGLRAPLNGTWLLQPVRRLMDECEELLIGKHFSATIWLPNGTILTLAA